MLQGFTDPEFLGLLVFYGIIFFIAWLLWKFTDKD